QYKKGALFLHTLRSVIDNDAKWHRLMHDYYQHFKYRTIMTTDVEAFFSARSGMKLKPMFDEYLRHAAIPTLQLRFAPDRQVVDYRWGAAEKDFAMPVKVGRATAWQWIKPTRQWQHLKTDLSKDEFAVATDYFYINVDKQ